VTAGRKQNQPQNKSPAASSRSAKCPICGKPRQPEYRPFCSARCADVDLNRWLSGHYAVPGEPVGSVPQDDEDDD
jgi:endogenous inhibitor of DNA gyrase (YacG/DUF329 family)